METPLRNLTCRGSFGRMRFVAGLIVSTLVLVGCTDAEERSLGELLDQINEPQDGGILLALVNADGSIKDAVKGATPLGPDDPIRIASITKAFTAVLVLTLVDDGLVDLDASASGYVPRLSLPDEITVRYLLNQRSGLADYTQAAIYGNTEDGNSTAWTPDELYQLIEDKSMTFPSGSRFKYNNTNYMVLGHLVEEVTGQPYHEALRERILDPIGLDATYLSHYEQGETPREGFTEQLGDSVVPVDFDYTAIATTVWSAGGLVSNVADVHEFFAALSRGEVISPPLFSELTTGTGSAGTQTVATTMGSVSNCSTLPHSCTGHGATYLATSPWSCTPLRHSKPSCMSVPTTDTGISHGLWTMPQNCSVADLVQDQSLAPINRSRAVFAHNFYRSIPALTERPPPTTVYRVEPLTPRSRPAGGDVEHAELAAFVVTGEITKDDVFAHARMALARLSSLSLKYISWLHGLQEGFQAFPDLFKAGRPAPRVPTQGPADGHPPKIHHTVLHRQFAGRQVSQNRDWLMPLGSDISVVHSDFLVRNG